MMSEARKHKNLPMRTQRKAIVGDFCRERQYERPEGIYGPILRNKN